MAGHLAGLRVEPSRWNAVKIWPPGGTAEDRDWALARERMPRERSSFSFLFEPILPDLAALWWHYDADCLLHGGWDVPEFAALLEEIAGDELVAPGVLLPKYANWIYEDWLYLYGLPRPSVRRPAFDEQIGRDPAGFDERFVATHCDVAFMNIDGAFWYMFSRRPEWLERVAAHVAGLGEPFRARSASWAEFKQ